MECSPIWHLCVSDHEEAFGRSLQDSIAAWFNRVHGANAMLTNAGVKMLYQWLLAAIRQLGRDWWALVRLYYARLKIDAGCGIYMAYVVRYNEIVAVCKKHQIENAVPDSKILRSMKGWEQIDPLHRPQVVTAPQAAVWEWKRISRYTQIRYQQRPILPYSSNCLSTTLMNEAGLDADGLLELRYMDVNVELALDPRSAVKESFAGDYQQQALNLQ